MQRKASTGTDWL